MVETRRTPLNNNVLVFIPIESYPNRFLLSLMFLMVHKLLFNAKLFIVPCCIEVFGDKMAKKNSLREIEKKTYMSYHQDGLLDIFVGVYILLFGLGILLSAVADFTWFIIPAIFPALMVPIWISAKKRITISRIGYVKIGKKGANKLMAILIGLMVVGLGTFTVFSFASTQGWVLTIRNLVVSNGLIIIGFGAAAISGLFAYTMGLKRLYTYGLLALVLCLAGSFITFPFEYILLIIGLVVVINGFVLLMQFIRKYPLPQGDETDAEKSF
jgi:hypothetical protein